ncbi:NUDIX hydrolase [Patescibacteria group bacterium]|nr:NUDIX hydrolase [Patescibacteria group bacterium]MBU1473030.1 NUDIX hydrolase [Patescibacteria group bacterium]MBU2460214.1 NUDIX hydrolase [Patescibacteria group bacterium]MBU2543899.1 NUDIX hydrolase [Patescibacteria group bacterium]
MNIQRPSSKQPIPTQAKNVFKGTIFDVYQWEQDLFNGEKTIFEKLKRPDTVNIIPITPNGEIIISEQEQPGTEPFIGCLGGRLDDGEEPLKAVKRELLEETGMEANEYILWDATQLVDKIDWAIYTFIAKGAHKVKEQEIEAGEKIKLKHVSFDEFIQMAAQDNFRDAEVALKIFRTMNNPAGFQEMKQLFSM